jgi:hypothetical protein
MTALQVRKHGSPLRTGEPQDAPFEPAHAVHSEVPTVDHRGHPHRNDESRRAPGEDPSRKAVLAVFDGDTRTHDLLDKGLEKGGHRPAPQREDQNEVLSRRYRVSRIDQASAQLAALEILPRAQDREIETRHFDPHDLVAGLPRQGGCRLDRDDLG